MTKVILIISLALNLTMASALYHYIQDYDSLLVWACDHGNGGYECGED